jgi:hypothetical protein
VTITADQAQPWDVLLDAEGTTWQRGSQHYFWATFTGPVDVYGPWEPRYGPQGELVLLVRDGKPAVSPDG